jgi:hypothetical protein
MRAKLPMRISSIILFLFALGHTAGFLQFRPVSAEALAVWESMRQVPFDFGGHTVHWADLYTGFGLAISVSGFVSAIMAWRLSTATAGERPLARTLAWLLCVIQVGGMVISLRYFGATQAVLSAVCAATLAWGGIRFGSSAETGV